MAVKQTSWIYQARRVCTRATNDGLTIVDISLATGRVARLISLKVTASGTNGINCLLRDEDNAIHNWLCTIASAAGTKAQLPMNVTTVTGSDSNIASVGLIIPSGALLSCEFTGNGANGDTMTVAVVLELFNSGAAPTWSVARSTGTAPTLAASTISAANTLTAGRLWT